MIRGIQEYGDHMFASLRIRNYRLYFIGQGFSHIGNWMQTVALGWLVLELTGSGVALGSVLAFRFAPLLLGGPFAGLIVDSVNKRQFLYFTQAASGVLALAMSFLVFTGEIEIWMVYVAAVLFGTVDVLDRPLLVALFFLRPDEFHRETEAPRPPDHLLAGLRYAASVPMIRNVLISMAVIGTLSYEFQVSLPLLAENAFQGGAADYAALLSAMGAGSVAGGLFTASRHGVTLFEFVASAFLFGVSLLLTALLPTLGLAIAGMVFVGFFSINLTSVGNTMIQLESAPHMRGRVMALWTMALFGSTLLGAPLIGWIAEHAGARSGLGIGGVAAILAALYAARTLLKTDEWRIIPASIRIRIFTAEADAGPK